VLGEVGGPAVGGSGSGIQWVGRSVSSASDTGHCMRDVHSRNSELSRAISGPQAAT
jgi:hypothetical protein